MKFTKLKITGFKSFVDTTVLDIKEGLTGLVVQMDVVNQILLKQLSGIWERLDLLD